MAGPLRPFVRHNKGGRSMPEMGQKRPRRRCTRTVEICHTPNANLGGWQMTVWVFARNWPIATDIALQPNVCFWEHSDRHSSGGVFGGK